MTGEGDPVFGSVCRQANCNDAFVGITEKIVDRIEGDRIRFSGSRKWC